MSPDIDGATGAFTYAVPFELPAARGEAQPSLALTYRSARGTGAAGESWDLNLPSIQREPLSGWPRYADDSGGPEAEDRYTFGGQPLTFLCVVGTTCNAIPEADARGPMPTERNGCRYYRLQVEGSFERFFLCNERATWVVQRRGGVTMELGTPITHPSLTPSATDVDGPGQIFRWNLVREYDRHGLRNLTVYSWNTLAGRRHLTDIHYTQAAANWSSPSLNDFAHHVQLAWETPTYLQFAYSKIDKRRPRVRLKRVAVASKTWSASGSRELVRAYNLQYFVNRTSILGATNEAPTFNRSYLSRIDSEGRCATPVAESGGQIPETTGCPALQPLTFEYQKAEPILTGTMVRSTVPSAGINDRNIPYVGQTAVSDVDGDGFPDIVQAWPQNFQGNQSSYATTWADCVEADGNDVKARFWIFETAFIPPAPRPFDPRLACKVEDGPTTSIRSAREHAVWINRGLGGAGLSFQHRCLDAGDGGVGTLTNYQVTPPPATAPDGSPAALFSQYGAETFGPWGDALLLWNRANYRGFSILASAPSDDRTPFCPQARGAGGDPSYPSMKWAETTDVGWAKRTTFTFAEAALAMVDIDGDGYLDRLGSTSTTFGSYRKASVLLTRKISHLETEDGITGPALIPFSGGGAEESAGPENGRVFYADINGDGLVDAIDYDPFVENGTPRVRPGNGRGHFGCEGQGDAACVLPGSGTWLGSGYRIDVPDAEKPWPLLQTSSPGQFTRVSYFHDVTGDGLADIVAYSPSARNVRLWINIDGHTFRCANVATGCVVGAIADQDGPGVSDLDFAVSFADVDANGTEDLVVLGSNAAWHFSFLVAPAVNATGPRASKPGLLKRIRNGTGADTEISYHTIQELDRLAQSAEPTSFTAPWLTHVPAVVPVVTNITTRDTNQVIAGTPLPEPFRVFRSTSFAYRNPKYDLWERRFVGFSRVRAERNNGEAIETRYWFGPCESGRVGDCLHGSDANPGNPQAWAKPYVGLPVRVDRYVPESVDLPAQWLSTTTYQYSGRLFISSQAAVSAQRDRNAQIASLTRIHEYHYDTALNVTQTPDDAIELPSELQPVPDHTTPGVRVHLETQLEYQAEGTLFVTWDLGRDPIAGVRPDKTIGNISLPYNAPRCGADWACLPQGMKVVEKNNPETSVETVLRQASFTRNAVGDLERIDAERTYPYASGAPFSHYMERHSELGTQLPWQAITDPDWFAVAWFSADEFGNTFRSMGGGWSSQSCTDVEYDAQYKQFPKNVTAYVGSGCTGTALTTSRIFDRGLGAVTQELAPDSASVTSLEYDGHGRLKNVRTPSPDGGPLATELALTLTHVTTSPLSYVVTSRRVDVDQFIDSIDVMNGLQEHVLGFDKADSAIDGAPWILRSWTERNPDGRVSSQFRPWFFSGDPYAVIGTGSALTPQGNRFLYAYDKFGRLRQRFDGLLITSRYTYHPLAVDVRDAEQEKASGPYAGLYSTIGFDGHGRVATTVARNQGGEITTTTAKYLGTGEPIEITRTGGGLSYKREMYWSTLGQLILNFEPNTSVTNGPTDRAGFSYAYDVEGRLVATSDARKCGKNITYDALGRVVAEDFSPCEAHQPGYSWGDSDTGDGTEVFYRYDSYEPGQLAPEPGFNDRPEYALGRLVSVHDRGAHTRFNYDARGRVRRETRRVANPGEPNYTLFYRYAANVFQRKTNYDLGDRLKSRSSGLADAELLVGGASEATYAYSARGLPATIGSSYGNLVTDLRFDASGNMLEARYGDAATTRVDRYLDARNRLERLHIHRPVAPAIWSSSSSTYTTPPSETTLLDLIDERLTLDDVSNPTTIADLSGAAWPTGAKPVTRTIQYDGLYRTKQVDYAHGFDEHIVPFEPEASVGDRRPVAEVRGGSRVAQQTFNYDALGNLRATDDNEHLRYDRSFGVGTHGRFVGGVIEGPNQLVDAPGIHADYDKAGNLVELTVARDSCWPAMPKCSHRFRYEWDEVGELLRAKRWDFVAGAVPSFDPQATPDWELGYAYSLGSRVLTYSKDLFGAERHLKDPLVCFLHYTHSHFHGTAARVDAAA